jgi:protein Mpv17
MFECTPHTRDGTTVSTVLCVLAQSFLGSAVVKAGLISGSLSLAGDLVAQLLVNWGKDSAAYDGARAARMGSFGLFLYGPYQHFWYSALDRAMPARTAANFATKVTMNQLLLAPLVVGGIFAWNLALQGRLGEWSGKTKADFVPTIVTGWKFWVPAATINFVAVPLRSQVLYMSCCGLVWTAFLSASSAEKSAPVQAPAKGRGKGKQQRR